jgi:anti-sigma regulatory factor (Ser/Thr protein kinase)
MCEWGLMSLAENAELVVSELVTNAVRASTGPDGRPRYDNASAGLPVVHLRVLSDRRRVVVEVWDTRQQRQSPRRPSPTRRLAEA